MRTLIMYLAPLLGESLTQIRAIGLVIAALGVWLTIGKGH